MNHTVRDDGGSTISIGASVSSASEAAMGIGAQLSAQGDQGW